jgi:prepilin-type N-terminal cleavage/methylation domain-containing protein
VMRLRRREAGFSLLEMAMVLVIIGVVMSAVMVGTDVLRHAKGQKAFSVFISGWHGAFSEFTRVTRSLPDDFDQDNQINGGVDGDGFLCRNDGLSGIFLGSSIRIPQGNGVTEETRYTYQDSSGSPQRLEVCFATINWSVQTSGAGFTGKQRHVMRIQGLTVELAMQMDVLIDGNLNARLGQFRLEGLQDSPTAENPGWGIPDTNGNAQPVVTAYFEMF